MAIRKKVADHTLLMACGQDCPQAHMEVRHLFWREQQKRLPACQPVVSPRAGVQLAPLVVPTGEEIASDCDFGCEIHTSFI